MEGTMTGYQASARTSVLTNSDLLYQILTFVAALRIWESRSIWLESSPLVQCVTVCRTFNELAIQLLWRTLPSLFPLWHLLAPRNTSHHTYLGEERPDYLRKVISARLYDDPVVWERFLWHATRVRHITHDTYLGDSPEKTVPHLLLIQAVLLKNGGKTVLPLLQSIHWDVNTPTDSPLVSFFTSTLRSATFSLRSASPYEETRALLFRRLHESSPCLEKLEIFSRYNDEDLAVGPRLVQELLLFDRLRQLTINCRLSEPATFLALVSKPGLTSLTVEDVPLGAPSPPFLVRDLLELSIRGTGPAVIGLLKLVRFDALKSATICIENTTDVEEETEAPSRPLPLTSPTTVESATEGAAISLRDLLRPVLPLREICSFTFNSLDLHPQIKVADVAVLAGAWPNLERLVLDVASPSSSEAFSLDALHYIHAHCPHLRELQTHSIRLPVLGVHAIPAPLDHSGSPPHALQRLWGGSELYVYRPEYMPGRIMPEHVEAFARYVLELFPALESTEYTLWCPRPGVRERSAPAYCYDGRKVLACIYTLASERELGRL